MVEIKKEFQKGGGEVNNNMKNILEFLKAREGIKMFMVVHRYFLESPKGEYLTFKLNFTNSGFSRNTTGKEKAKAFNVVNKVESHD